MKIRRVSPSRQVKIARQSSSLNTQKAMEILQGYGKTLSDKLLGAMKELDKEKQASLEALKDVGTDVRAQVMEKYDNIDKSMGYLGSIADLLVVNDPQRWLEAKTTGIFRKKYNIEEGDQAGTTEASQGADLTTAPAAPTTTTPKGELEVRPPRKDMVPGKGQATAPEKGAAEPLGGGVKLTTEDSDVALKSARELALNDKMIFLANIQGYVHAINDAVKGKRPEEEQFKLLLKNYRGIGKLITFVSSYNPSTNKKFDFVDGNYYHLTTKQIQKTVDRYFSTMEERLANSRLSFIDFIKEIVKRAEAIIATNEYDKVHNRQIVVAKNNPAAVLKDELGTIKAIHDKFLVHMKGVGQHIAGVFKGVSQYATRPEVQANQDLSSMLSTVTNTLRWSASLVANAINENEDSKKFWDAAMKDGLKMMEAEKVKGLVGEVDPQDILKDAVETAAKEEALKLVHEPAAEGETPEAKPAEVKPTEPPPAEGEKASEVKPDVSPAEPTPAEEKALVLNEKSDEESESPEKQLAKMANDLAKQIAGLAVGDYVKVVQGVPDASYPGVYEVKSFNEDGTAGLAEVGGLRRLPGVPLYGNVNGKLVVAWQKLTEEEKSQLPQPSGATPSQVAEEPIPSAESQPSEAVPEQPVQEPAAAGMSEAYYAPEEESNPAFNNAVAKANASLGNQGEFPLNDAELEALRRLMALNKRNLDQNGYMNPSQIERFTKMILQSRHSEEDVSVQASASFIKMVNAHLECGGHDPLLDGERMSVELAISEGRIGISSASPSGLRSIAESLASKIVSGRHSN